MQHACDCFTPAFLRSPENPGTAKRLGVSHLLIFASMVQLQHKYDEVYSVY